MVQGPMRAALLWWSLAALASTQVALAAELSLGQQANILQEFRVGAVRTVPCCLGSFACTGLSSSPPSGSTRWSTHARAQAPRALLLQHAGMFWLRASRLHTRGGNVAPPQALAGFSGHEGWEGDNPCIGSWDGIVCNSKQTEVVAM